MCRSRIALLMLVSLVALMVGLPAAADVKLPAIISDNMVLQADLKDPIWGWAEPGEKVTVAVAGQTASAAADKDGRWEVRLGPIKAGGPLEMTVAGKNTLTVKNILVGEVWVCSGQSNMEFGLKGANNGMQEVEAAKVPKIRLFRVEKATSREPLKDCKGQWMECTPETAGGFSAVAYFFGRDLQKVLDVPVGLIGTYWGGTPAEAWTSADILKSDTDFKAIYDRFQESLANYPKAKENWEANRESIMKKWEESAKKAKAEGKPEPRKPGGPGDPATSAGGPSNLYNAMIAPIVPYGIRGATWYQGESNAGRAYEYRRLFPAMITDWRKHWGEGDFPFLFVQLANFMARKDQPADSAWAELREAQTMTLKLPQTGMAVIIDIGDEKDIHPKNKQDVGRRLALGALGTVYGKDMVYSGPMYDSMKVEGGAIRLTFKHVGGGLVARGEKLTGFAIAGEDRKFVWADARIDSETVVVSSKEVAKPVAVRYAWADNPECNLYNKAGLPASPFRTDDWPGITQLKK